MPDLGEDPSLQVIPPLLHLMFYTIHQIFVESHIYSFILLTHFPAFGSCFSCL